MMTAKRKVLTVSQLLMVFDALSKASLLRLVFTPAECSDKLLQLNVAFNAFNA